MLAVIINHRIGDPKQAKEVTDRALVDLYKSVRKDHIAWGFAMIYAYLRNKGHIFCKKRGHRLYKQAGLSLHRKPPHRRSEKSPNPQRIQGFIACQFY